MKDKLTAEFTNIAKDDLNKILDYIEFELSNPKAAYDFVEKVFGGIDNACENPNMYQFAQNELIVETTVRRIIVGNYKIFYKTKENRLTVLRIVYSKIDMSEILS